MTHTTPTHTGPSQNARPKGQLWLALTGLVLITSAASLALAEGDKAKDGEEENAAAAALEANAALPEPSGDQVVAGRKAFIEVAKVLQSPRCMNCHPTGDRPLQTDQSVPHAMNISRESLKSGMACSTCHREENSDEIGIIGGPPGAPHWGLPPEETPMIFQDLSPALLCDQLQDPVKNGNRSLQDLLEHVTKDPLVLWGWNPGGNRTKPPLTHQEFVRNFTLWVQAKGACPE